MSISYRVPSLLLLCSALLAGASLNAQTVLFKQDWNSYSLGSSIANNEGTGNYRWFAIPPEGTAATGRSALINGTEDKKFLSVKSVFYSETGSYNPVLISNQITSSSRISLSNTLNTTISGDVRLRTPGATFTATPYPIMEVWANGSSTGDANKFSFGIYSGTQAFVKLPGMAQQWVTGSYGVNTWYRFSFELNPVSQDIVVSLFSLDDDGVQTLVWGFSATDKDSGYSYLAESISSYRYTVSKPTSGYGSADFGDFTITQVPEPTTVAALMGAGVLAAAFVIRRRKRTVA